MGLPYSGRAVTRVAINQGAAGSTDLVTAVAGQYIYVVSFVITLDATGTLKFQSGTGPTDLSGTLNIAANGGLVADSDVDSPILRVAALGDKLTILTATGKAQGWLNYYTDPK